MRTLLLLMSLLTIAPAAIGQTEDELKALAMEQARITSAATVAGDYDTVLDYTMPEVLDLMGGKEAALKNVEAAMEKMYAEGLEITSSEVVKLVGFAYEQDQYRCVIENHIVMKMGADGTLDSTSYLLGFYNEEKMRWYYIEANEFKNPQIKSMLFPDTETKLNIPEDVRKFID